MSANPSLEQGFFGAPSPAADPGPWSGPLESPCSPWHYIGHAAPLYDPGAFDDNTNNPFTGCDTPPATGWRLRATSPAICRLPDGRSRMFFHGGSLIDDTGDTWPSMVTATFADGAQGPVRKFSLDAQGEPIRDTNQLLAWWRAAYTQGKRIDDLCFSPDFIGFLDSDDGIEFPIYAPLMSNQGSPNSCEFKIPPIYENSSFRAGWCSTVIPCGGASIVYQSDTVISLRVGGRLIYVMFAVMCDGRGHNNGAEINATQSASCSLCEPIPTTQGACRTNMTPDTNYVFFLCDSPDFIQGVMGPFVLLQQPPDYQQGQWIGVPQAFLSPDEELLYFYIHPQRLNDADPQPMGQDPSPHPQYGLNVARIADVRRGISLILSSSPRRSDAYGLPNFDIRETRLGRRVGDAFINLGRIRLCRQEGSFGQTRTTTILPQATVDEHFVFCGQRLHLFTTFVARWSGDPQYGTEWLREIWHASARIDLDANLLEEYIGYRTAIPTIAIPDVVADALLQFNVLDCEVFDIANQVGAEIVTEPSTNRDILAQLNDPTAWVAPFWENGEMVLFFHSQALRGLEVLVTTDACEMGTCGDP